MRTTNTKASRTFDALACTLNYLPDKTIYKIHSVINDKRDGYNFNFIAAVNSYRQLCGDDVSVTIKPFTD